MNYRSQAARLEEFNIEKGASSHCYIDLIKHPPSQLLTQNPSLSFSVQIPIVKPDTSTKIPKLNVASVLKMPHRVFLVFFHQNYYRIAALTTPEQFALLQQYRQDALDSQSAIHRVRQRISKARPEDITRLPTKTKQKLFELLYEDSNGDTNDF